MFEGEQLLLFQELIEDLRIQRVGHLSYIVEMPTAKEKPGPKKRGGYYDENYQFYSGRTTNSSERKGKRD